jgi:vancomycin resistance protein VanJ
MTDQPQSVERRSWSKWSIGLPIAIWLVWLIGQFFRDATFLTGLCFYFTSLLFTLLLLVWAIVHLVRRQRKAAILALLLLLLPFAMVLFVENRLFSNSGEGSPHSVRLVHWNVAGKLERRGAIEVLTAQQSQLYILSEIPNADAVTELALELGPSYQSHIFSNLAVIGQGKVTEGRWLINRGRTKVYLVRWQHSEQHYSILVVDLPSEIHIWRDPLLRELNDLIEQHRPDLVVGDFNAPRRSKGLSELPKGYCHAYDVVGSGFGYTWPMPLPMYAIDQCICGPRITPHRYQLFSGLVSDHRGQVFEFTKNDKAN